MALHPAYNVLPIGQALDLREVSIVLRALIGAVFLHERLGPVRVAGAAIVLTGVVMLSRG